MVIVIVVGSMVMVKVVSWSHPEVSRIASSSSGLGVDQMTDSICCRYMCSCSENMIVKNIEKPELVNLLKED